MTETNDKLTTIVWFRNDLRITDHPALSHAAAHGPVIPVFVLDESNDGTARGAASRWWLHHSLTQLRQDLGRLVLLRGRPDIVLPELARRTAARGVVWNREYEPRSRVVQDRLQKALSKGGTAHESFPGSLLWEPGRIRTLADKPFKVFTPFWRACLKVPVLACSK